MRVDMIPRRNPGKQPMNWLPLPRRLARTQPAVQIPGDDPIIGYRKCRMEGWKRLDSMIFLYWKLSDCGISGRGGGCLVLQWSSVSERAGF